MNTRQARRLVRMEADVAHGISATLGAHYRSAAWQRARSIRCLWAFGHCEMCGDTGREAHHLTYRRMGAWNEFLDLRYLCHECHKAQHQHRKDWAK